MQMKYRQFRPSDAEVVSELIQSLYREDPSDKPMLPQKIRGTFDSLTRHPDRGAIMVFEHEGEIAGYAILINFWSNEFGGNITFIDELYVRKEFRGRGVGTNFIRHLAETRAGDSVALQLEVTPGNAKARKLYESLGFKPHKNSLLELNL